MWTNAFMVYNSILEVRHTEHGDQILRNFLFEICQANADWKIETRIPDKIAEIQQIVGKDQIILDYLGVWIPSGNCDVIEAGDWGSG